MLGLGFANIMSVKAISGGVGDVLLLLHAEAGAPLVDSSSYNRTMTKIFGTDFLANPSYKLEGTHGIQVNSSSRYESNILSINTSTETIVLEFGVTALSWIPISGWTFLSIQDYEGDYLSAYIHHDVDYGIVKLQTAAGLIELGDDLSWYFIRLVLAGSVLKVYSNGILIQQAVFTRRTSSGVFFVLQGGQEGIQMFLDEVRVSTGVALGAGMPTFPLTTTP